jgi:predicted acyl esterase
MKIQVYNLAMALVCLCGMSARALGRTTDTTVQGITFIDQITINSPAGVTLNGNVFVPDGEGPFPALIFPASWGMDEYEYIVQARSFALEGYVVLAYTARGWGESTGMIGVASREDMVDLSAVIDHLFRNFPVDQSRLGLAGISYGGGLSLLGTGYDSRVKTAMIMSGWADLLACLYGEDTPRLVWGNILLLQGQHAGNLDPQTWVYFENLVNHHNLEDTYIWAEERSAITYLEDINARNIPICFSQNLQDELFQPNTLLDFYQKLDHPEKKLEIQLGIHASAEVSGLLGIPNETWERAHRWFEHYLLGVNNGIACESSVRIKVKNTGDTIELEDWPSRQVQSKTFYLKPRNRRQEAELGDHPYSRYAVDSIRSGYISGANTGMPVIGPLFEAHSPHEIQTDIDRIDHRKAIVYYSVHSTQVQYIVGIPHLSLSMVPDGKALEVVAYLFDLDESNTGTLITHGPCSRHDLSPGQEFDIQFELIMTSYQLDEGHRLALVIDTYDAPYASPPEEGRGLQLLYGAGRTPELTLPLLHIGL